jgi:CheY-like chemotaxis protein
MSDRVALVIEPDETFAAAFRHMLTPYGFHVDVLADGNQAVEVAQGSPPDLILLSVEPKNVGYAICNKIKKNTGVKHIPLILLSSEASPETFEQHRKLKTRADEYYIKTTPDQMDELLQKIDTLCPLGEPVTEVPIGGVEDIDIPVDGMEEISLDEEDVALVDEEPATVAPAPAVPQTPSFEPDEDKTRVTIESDIDDAFATLEIGQDGKAVAAPEVSPEASIDEAVGYGEPPPLQAVEPEPELEPAAIGVDFAPQATDPAAAELQQEETIDLGLDAITDNMSASSPETFTVEADVSPDLREQIVQLEEERDRLKSDLQTARGQPSAAAAPFSREREFLNLREIINKKEKEILDFKDELDAKDRLILDHKDKVRELERKSRDLDERILNLERQIVAGNEKIAAFTHDKEKGFERERQVKARLDDAQREIQKLHEELDSHKKRHTTALEQAKSELERTRAEAAQRVADLESELRATVDRMTRERQETEVSQRSAHERTVEELRADAERRLAERQQAHAAEVVGLNQGHQAEIQSLRDRHQGEVLRLRRDHDSTQAALREEHAAEVAGLREAQEIAARELEARLQDALAQAEQRRLSELMQAEQRRQGELAEAHQQYQALDQQRQGELAEAHQQHQALDQQRQGELAEAHQQYQALDQQRQGELAEAHQQYQALDQQRQGELAEAEQRRQGELLQAEQRRQSELAQAEQRRQSELSVQAEAHRAELQALVEQHQENVAQLEAAHAAAVSGLEQSYADEKTGIVQRYEGELREARERYQALEQQRQGEVAEARQQYRTLDQQRQSELLQGEQRRQSELADAERRRQDELAQAEQQRRGEEDEARKRIASLDHELTLKQQRGAELGQALDAARADIAERDGIIAQRDATVASQGRRIEELETQSGAYQEQGLRAMTKLRSDQALTDKAKKALAIALMLLEEEAKSDLNEPVGEVQV